MSLQILLDPNSEQNKSCNLYANSINLNTLNTDSIVVNKSITLPTLGPQLPLVISDSGVQQSFAINYSGAWVASGVGSLYINKIGNFVYLVYSQQAPATVSTAQATLNLSTVLPLGYRPPFVMSAVCTIYQAALSPTYNAGVFSIKTDGTMTIGSLNNGGTLFPVGQSCGLISTISIAYPST